MSGLGSVVDVVTRHWRDGRGKVLLAISAGWFLSIGVRFVYPVLLPYIRDEYALSLTAAGALITTLWFAYALGQLPGGVLADRIGEGRTMVVSMAVATGTLTLVVLAGSSLVYAATATLGFSIALFGVVRLSSVSNIYPEQVGTAHGLMAAIGDIANTGLPPLAALVAAATAWQLGFGMLVPVFAAVAVLLYVVVPARTSPPAESGALSLDTVRTVVPAIRRPAVLLVTIVFVTHVSIMQAFTGFYPTYLIEQEGLSAGLASGLFALFFALGVAIKPVAGNAYDRYGARRTLLVVTGVSGAAFLLLPVVDSLPGFVVVTVVASFMLGKGTTAISYMTVSIPEDIRNTGLGVLRTVGFTIGATSPLAFGAIADAGYFDEAFLLLAAVTAVSLVVIWRLPPIADV